MHRWGERGEGEERGEVVVVVKMVVVMKRRGGIGRGCWPWPVMEATKKLITERSRIGMWLAKREALKQRPVRRSVQLPGGGAGTVSRC